LPNNAAWIGKWEISIFELKFLEVFGLTEPHYLTRFFVSDISSAFNDYFSVDNDAFESRFSLSTMHFFDSQ